VLLHNHQNALIMFAMFIQAGDNTVVLLARDTPPNHPSTRDLGVDMSQVRRNT
jgi:hypothetical protein